jgi:hypothetical protein
VDLGWIQRDLDELPLSNWRGGQQVPKDVKRELYLMHFSYKPQQWANPH